MTSGGAGFETKYPMVRVEWEDSAILPRSWQDLEEIVKTAPVLGVTSGWMVRDDEVGVTVVGSYGQQEKPDVLGGMMIPRSAVRKVERLAVVVVTEDRYNPPQPNAPGASP